MSYLAGNAVIAGARFTPPAGVTVVVDPDAATAVTDAAGVTTELAGATVDITANVVTVEVPWAIPDDAPEGTQVITIDLSGSMVAAAEIPIEVEARWAPVVP